MTCFLLSPQVFLKILLLFCLLSHLSGFYTYLYILSTIDSCYCFFGFFGFCFVVVVVVVDMSVRQFKLRKKQDANQHLRQI